MTRVRRQGRVSVALPVGEAMRLFTPSGERVWAHGWDPVFPVATDDETAPGTVFQTGAHGPVTWVAAARNADHSVRYALVQAGVRAGIVEVECAAAEDGTTVATVSYDMTALGEEGERWLEEFADGYEAFMAQWSEAIAAVLVSGC